MWVLPSMLAVHVTDLPSGEKFPPSISHLSCVSQSIFLVAMSSRPTLS